MHTFFGLTAGKSLVASSRRAALTAVLLASALTAAAPAMACEVAELSNGWVKPAGNPITGFEVDFAGNVTAVIPAQVTDDPMTNAFAALDDWDNLNQVNPITVVYDGGANLTRVKFSSQGQLPGAVPANWGSFGPDQYNDTYHFGFNPGSQCSVPTTVVYPVSEHWIYPNSTQEVPFLNGSWAGTFTAKPRNVLWAAIYTETKDRSTGVWQLIAYPRPRTGGAVKIKLTNGSQMPVTIGNTGYVLGISPPTGDCLKSPQCAANQAALEQLNGVAMPVPGAPGSPFKPIKVSRTLPPGGYVILSLR